MILRPSRRHEDIIWTDLILAFIVNLSLSGRFFLAASFCPVTEYRHGPKMSQGRGKYGACRPVVLSRRRSKQ